MADFERNLEAAEACSGAGLYQATVYRSDVRPPLRIALGGSMVDFEDATDLFGQLSEIHPKADRGATSVEFAKLCLRAHRREEDRAARRANVGRLERVGAVVVLATTYETHSIRANQLRVRAEYRYGLAQTRDIIGGVAAGSWVQQFAATPEELASNEPIELWHVPGPRVFHGTNFAIRSQAQAIVLPPPVTRIR